MPFAVTEDHVLVPHSERGVLTVYFDDVTPRGFTTRRRPVLSNVQSVLFVIDSVNTPVGTNGRIWIDDVKYAR